jgi:alpha-ketoglutarate-dependent taurine dioxygenase
MWHRELSVNLSEANDRLAKQLAVEVLRHTVVVVKDQKLTPQQELEFCEKIGKVQKLPSATQFAAMDPKKEQLEKIRATYAEEDEDGNIIDGIFRVTGKKNKDGNEGLFGHKRVLDWHANQPSSETRAPCIWIYGVSGTEGSRTSWINMALAFKDLPKPFQEELETVTVYCGFKKGGYTDSEHFNEHVNRDNPLKLVHTNPDGQKGLYYPFNQIMEWQGGRYPGDQKYYDHIKNKLIQHTTQEKYTYHHDWKDGDIVISDQWLSIHKRWHYEDMENRLMHRIAFGYENL